MLSIVVPVYNVAETLGMCVGSIVGQCFEDWELIMVDDGATDGSPALCDLWAERDARIRVVHQANGGLSAARNTGIEWARGEYITFVDSDDWLDTDTYARVLPLMQREGADLLEFSFERFGCGAPEPFVLSDAVFACGKGYFRETRAYTHFYSWNKIYHRRLFADIRFPVGKVFEDAHTTPLVIEQATRIVTTSQGCYHYRQNPKGITHTATGVELGMLLRAYTDIMLRWPDWVDDNFYLHTLNVQLDVQRLTGEAPILSHRRCALSGLNGVNRLKMFLNNYMGINILCRIHRLFVRR